MLFFGWVFVVQVNASRVFFSTSTTLKGFLETLEPFPLFLLLQFVPWSAFYIDTFSMLPAPFPLIGPYFFVPLKCQIVFSWHNVPFPDTLPHYGK
jgi:hypothetical protein